MERDITSFIISLLEIGISIVLNRIVTWQQTYI